ncbi:MAG: Lar family restriction alleviation protein [Synergistaceae bacterium]|nr:Lar family restriction alleviation protein [Synergistaceae bacterium]
MPDLKPCPFCGGAAGLAGFWRHVIRCTNCGCQSAPFSKLGDAVDAWNNRALTATQRHGDELYEALGYVLTQLKLAFMGFSDTTIDANELQALCDRIEEGQDEQ